MDHQVQQDHQDLLVSPVHPVYLELLEPQDTSVKMVLLDQWVPQDHLDSLANLDLLEKKEIPDQLVFLEPQDYPESLENLVSKVTQGETRRLQLVEVVVPWHPTSL